jgi:uncharacterized damage-inducible protein DinB
MAIKDVMLSEFDHEMANTRKTLERVPEEKFAWKPHQKSGTMIWLANHIAEMPGWSKYTFEHESLDLAAGGERPPEPKSRKELLEKFDTNLALGREALAAATDAQMMAIWTLKSGAQTIFSLPRAAVFRTMIMNHLIHHRAQLTVYLRLNDVPVPALYGPSADEK